MGTVYIDAQAAAEDSTTHEALNEIVEKGIVSAKELDESIKTGKPLTIESGKYMQLASEETPKILSDYTTMDKGERTIHDLNEIRNREKELRDLIHSTKAEREQRAGRKIMDVNFPANGTEFDKEDRATFASLLPGGLENLKDNAKEALNEAMENWMDMLPDVKEHMEYIRQKQNGKGQGEVSVIYRENDSQGAQWESVRVSSNDAWYSAAFKEKGAMPGQRDIIDYDYEQYLKELEASVKPGDAEGEMLIQNLKDAKKRVESLERVNHFVSNLDKEDLTAQALLDPETYEKVYKPYLKQIQMATEGTKAKKSERDSALILSKIAENMNKNYGIPLEMAMAKIMKRQKSQDVALAQYMSPEDQLKIDTRYFMNQVNRAVSGNLKSEYIRVMRTPLVMKLVGAKVLPITLSAYKLNIILSDHSESINKEFLQQIPEALADPMMVFKTYNGKNNETRKVFVIDVKDSHGATVVIPIQLDTKIGEYHVNKINSIFGKNDGKSGNPVYKFFKANIEKGNVEYVNKKKTAAWYSSEEVYSSIPEETMSSLLDSNLPNEDDLVKLKEDNPTYYQMVGEHANSAPEDKLQMAASMEKDGISPEEIWNTTGWMRGPDHKWRFEIPDNKEIKDYLKQHGAFIRLYDPKVEGDRERVTNSAQKRANQYFQNNGKYQGAYDPSQNMIELFDGANQSTVIHEGAHMFLSLLEKMENLTEEDIENYFEGDRDKAAKTSERVRKDLSTIREWVAFSEEHLEEYKGTVLEKEFNKHAEDIRNGVEGAEERWIQERFARGFEKYLAEGSAPTKELRGVFRRFKSWLKDIYKSAKNLGSARLSPEIKDSFDHMISVAIESKGSL